MENYKVLTDLELESISGGVTKGDIIKCIAFQVGYGVGSLGGALLYGLGADALTPDAIKQHYKDINNAENEAAKGQFKANFKKDHPYLYLVKIASDIGCEATKYSFGASTGVAFYSAAERFCKKHGIK